jgi:GntR family transcriptional regulator / MocR family aminotransferase
MIVTLGAQHALFLLSNLLIRKTTKVGIEDPGYPDARNIFATMTDKPHALATDATGFVISESVTDCDYLYVTVGHQCAVRKASVTARRRQAT